MAANAVRSAHSVRDVVAVHRNERPMRPILAIHAMLSIACKVYHQSRAISDMSGTTATTGITGISASTGADFHKKQKRENRKKEITIREE